MDSAFEVAAAWDGREGAGISGQAAQPIGIVTLVAEEVTNAHASFEKCRCGLHVADVIKCRLPRKGAVEDVGERRPVAAQSSRERAIA